MANEEPGDIKEQARNHRPAIIAIVLAVLVVVLGWIWLGGGDPESDVSRTVPDNQPLTPAEGAATDTPPAPDAVPPQTQPSQ